MSFDFDRLAEDKRELRRNLAARPVVERLLMLDRLRERELAIRGTWQPQPNTGRLPQG